MLHRRSWNRANTASRYSCGRSRCYVDPAFCMTLWLPIRSVYACIRIKSRSIRMKNSAILFVYFLTSYPPNTPFTTIIPNCHEKHIMMGSNTLNTTSYFSPQVYTSLPTAVPLKIRLPSTNSVSPHHVEREIPRRQALAAPPNPLNQAYSSA
jgi:hypothetical protein